MKLEFSGISKNLKFQISWKFVQWEQTDGHTVTIKVIVTFRKVAKGVKKVYNKKCFPVRTQVLEL